MIGYISQPHQSTFPWRDAGIYILPGIAKSANMPESP
jgi:hypothetical protein